VDGYDEAMGFLVRARSEKHARKLAAGLDEHGVGEHGGPGDEGHEAWLDGKQTSCETLPVLGPAGVLMRDFKAG